VVARCLDGPIDLAVTPDGKTVFALNSNSVVPISTATNRHGRPISLAVPASTMVMAPDGRTLYVLGDASVIAVNVRTCSAGPPIPACPSGACGDEMALAPDGRTLYVPDFNAGTVVPLSTVTHRAGKPIRVGAFPDAVVVTPDGRTVLVACDKSVYRISTATRHAHQIRLTFDPAWIAITPDGKTAW
jgi:hyaluronoglucosaminidase